jgi:hypothetical protein
MTYNEAAKKYLSPPDYIRFVENIKTQKRPYRYLNTDCNRNEFIDDAFTWAYTPEGHDYWSRLHQIRKYGNT